MGRKALGQFRRQRGVGFVQLILVDAEARSKTDAVDAPIRFKVGD